MEKARQGSQSVGRMIFVQCTEIINPATSNGLPADLIAEDPSKSLIFKGTDLNIAALQAELGFLATPVNHVQTTEMGNQALNPFALISARYTHTANDVLSQFMAAHLIALCQALDLRAMHFQFLELYRPRFVGLIIQHYTTGKDATVQGSSAGREFSDFLCSKLLKSFDATASMGSDERFSSIAKSLRPEFLDYTNINTSANFASLLERFTGALAVSLEKTWCAHRDTYMLHGDATPVLGIACKTIYTFIRRTLQVPFLCTRVLMTPKLEKLGHARSLDAHAEAPTVGSYNGMVYRDFRDGTLAKVGVDILRTTVKVKAGLKGVNPCSQN